MKRYKGELFMLVTAVMWGSGFVGMAVGLRYWSVFQLMAGRFLIASLLLTLVFHKKLRLLSKEVIAKGALLGLFLFTGFTLQTKGLEFTTPSKNAFLTATNVIIVPLIGWIIYKRRIARFEWIAAGVMLTGVGLLSLNDTLTMSVGDVLSLLCAVAFAFDIFYTNVFVKTSDALALTIVQFYTATILSVGAVLVRGEVPTAFPTEGIAVILYLAVFCTTLAYACQNVGMQYADPTKSALILSTEALFGTLFSVLLLGEWLTGRMIVGGLLIFGAILIAEMMPLVQAKRRRTISYGTEEKK
ncbi:EamA family transporter [Planococcaceae bacterium Storch 2/2-2]|nr:EamA family transporter [Planococcaceae bacterium Storch 2/2-2]